MPAELRESLAIAVAYVSREKRRAYTRATSGVTPRLDGWMARQPELARHVALLNTHYVDVDSIPMEQAA